MDALLSAWEALLQAGADGQDALQAFTAVQGMLDVHHPQHADLLAQCQTWGPLVWRLVLDGTLPEQLGAASVQPPRCGEKGDKEDKEAVQEAALHCLKLMIPHLAGHAAIVDTLSSGRVQEYDICQKSLVVN